MNLTQGPVNRRLAELWLPMIGGIVAIKSVGLADVYFVGRLGEDALAAISFTFPIVMTLISLAIGLSAGAASVLSRAIGGQATQAEQREIVTGAIAIGILIAVALAGAGWFTIGPVLHLMGARGEILGDATAFMHIWFGGYMLLIVPIAVNGMLRATGDGRSPAMLMVAVAVLNVALDPLFIFGFGAFEGYGMQGAAVATLCARMVSLLAAMWLIASRDLLAVSVSTLAAGLGRWREIARVGLPASLSTSLNPVALSIATAAVATLGAAEVAAFGVVTKIQSFAIVPLLALSSAAPAIVGQNSAARKYARSRRALLSCAVISAGWSVIVAVVFAAGAEPIVSLFTDSARAQEAAALYLLIVPLSYAGYGIVVALSAGMNALGRSVHALLIAGGRAIVLLAPAAWIGVSIGGFAGVAAATAVVNVVSGLIALTIILKDGLETRDGDESSASDLAEVE